MQDRESPLSAGVGEVANILIPTFLVKRYSEGSRVISRLWIKRKWSQLLLEALLGFFRILRFFLGRLRLCRRIIGFSLCGYLQTIYVIPYFDYGHVTDHEKLLTFFGSTVVRPLHSLEECELLGAMLVILDYCLGSEVTFVWCFTLSMLNVVLAWREHLQARRNFTVSRRTAALLYHRPVLPRGNPIGCCPFFELARSWCLPLYYS